MGVGTRQKLEALKQGFSGPLFVIDSSGRYREVTEGEYDGDLLYVEPDSLAGQRFHDLFDDALADRFLSAVQAALDTGSPEVLEYELSVPAGDRWFEATVAPVSASEEPPDVTLWAVRDITDRKRHELAITELHQTAIALQTSDSEARICQQTIDAAESILDFDQSVLALEADGELQVEATSAELPDDAVRTLSVAEGIAGETYCTGETFQIDDLEDADGAVTDGTFRSCLSLPIGDHGNFQAIDEEPGAFDEADQELAELLIAQTQAALTRLEQTKELKRRNDRLEEFASIVSHDLRTPLTVATGHVDLARSECESTHLTEVQNALDRMEALVDDLLTLARSGEDSLEVTTVHLGSMVEQCWRSLDSADATLTLEADDTLRADEILLRQLLENLIANAVEHGGDEITVGLISDGFFVADDGPGIPDERRDQIFAPGYSDDEEGTGFGLRIVKQVVEVHDWEVRVTEGPDGGARFEVSNVDLAAG